MIRARGTGSHLDTGFWGMPRDSKPPGILLDAKMRVIG